VALPYRVETFVGPEEDYNRLIKVAYTEYTHTSQYLQHKFHPDPSYNRMGFNVRPDGSTVVNYGGGNYPTTVRRTSHLNWTNRDEDDDPIPGAVPRAREVVEYNDYELYRQTYIDYAPTTDFHDNHNYVEVRDASGELLSSTDTEWNINRLTCRLRRQANSLGTCGSPGSGEDSQLLQFYHGQQDQPHSIRRRYHRGIHDRLVMCRNSSGDYPSEFQRFEDVPRRASGRHSR